MCGIAGIRRYGDKPIEEIHIRMLLTGMEHRGNDATGIAMQKANGQVLVLKDDRSAWDFVKGDKYETFLAENLDNDVIQVLLHTRAATKGNPRRAKNNHPLFSGKAAVVHNGVLHNDDQLFREFDLERTADTDSDIIRAIIDKWGITPEAIKKMNKIRGGAATAALHPDYPGKMLLGRSGNPITIGSDENFFVFASEKNVIHRAMRPWVQRWGKWFQKQSLDLAFSPFPNDTLWIIGENLDEFHDEFKIHIGTYHEPCRRVYTGWKERQRKWDQEGKPEKSNPTGEKSSVSSASDNANTKCLVICPGCKKELCLKPEQLKTPLYHLYCPKSNGGCGARLGDYKRPDSEAGTEAAVHIN